MKLARLMRRRPLAAALAGLLAALALVLFLGPGDRTSQRDGSPSEPTHIVQRVGDGLTLDGKPWHFTGVNAYQLATDYAVNVGCGPALSDPDQLLSTLPRGSVVRFWAFQAMAVSPLTHKRTWAALDRVVGDATNHGIKLVMVLSDQSGTCDNGHFHSRDWYVDGWRQRFDDNHHHTDLVSYAQWVGEIVPRYADQSAVAYWEPVNEPETSVCDAGLTGTDCYGHNSCAGGNAEVLRDWFTVIGAAIHRLDRLHPVASGQLGQGECASYGPSYAIVGSSPGLDVLTVHDYATSEHTGADDRIAQAHTLGKPLVFEEAGTEASPSGSGCPTLEARAVTLGNKAAHDLAQPGVVGFLPWQWLLTRDSSCEVAITPGDPLLAKLAALGTDS